MHRNDNGLTYLLAGAGLMYLLDPDRGARRRAMLRDRFVHTYHTLDEGFATAATDLQHRATGIAAETRSRLRPDEADDDVLEARVRSQLGRAVSHPGAIEVQVQSGRVVLSGPILAHEVDPLLSAIRAVRGVDEVVDQLEAHPTAGDVPALQGAGRTRQSRPEPLQENWTPGLRLLAGVLGGAIALRGMRSPGLSGAVMTATGLGLAARATSNLSVKRLTGVDAGRRAVDLQKTINVAAPIDEVWELWSHFENFPRFMSHLKEVRVTDEGRHSHWVAVGPAGAPVEWDAEVTEWIPNERIAWKSTGGGSIQNAGIVQFQPLDDGGTRIEVRMSYNPPAGALGHVVASLFRTDPKRAMDEDLVRLKSLLEYGKTRGAEGLVTRDELQTSTR